MTIPQQPLPQAIWSGTFTVFGVEMKCHVLNDGRRVIEAESLEKLFEVWAAGEAVPLGDINDFARWQQGVEPKP